MTHTPGPWKYTRWTHHIVDSTGTGIAFEVAHEDDARLIATAPMLLEACKAAFDAIKSLDENALGVGTYTESNGEPAKYPIRDEVLNNIAIAIAAAEGEQ